jgi:N-acetylmuramoyl-L-alanine amidase
MIMGRKIKRIVIHTTATPESWEVSDLLDYFYKEKGWEHPGYHIVVERDGRRRDLLPPELIANGAKGYNRTSLHIAYLGGLDENNKAADTRTEEQKRTLAEVVRNFNYILRPVEIVGHRDLSPDVDGSGEVEPDEWIKVCPCFEVSEWLKTLEL